CTSDSPAETNSTRHSGRDGSTRVVVHNMLEKPSAVIGGTVRPQVASTAFVVPVALQSSGIQRTRPDVHRPAAQVGAGASSGGSTSRNRGSLSSAAPQTIADPAIRVLWQAEEVQAHGRGGRSNSGRIAAAASLEVESSSGRGGALGD
ncbi:unnamed protein product, partial [Pylaiella littoralis]